MKKDRIAKCLQKVNKKKEGREDTETWGEYHIARRQKLKCYGCKSGNAKVYCRQTTESWGVFPLQFLEGLWSHKHLNFRLLTTRTRRKYILLF